MNRINLISNESEMVLISRRRTQLIFSISLLVVVFTAPLSLALPAQEKPKPDLSGVWVVDQTRSDKSNNTLENSEISVTIQQTENEITMVRRYQALSLTVKYFTDGREVSTKGSSGASVVKARTKWDGDKLTSRTVTRRIVMNRPVDLDIVEEWRLSKDGGTLTKKTIIIYPKNAPDKVNAVAVAQPAEEFKKVYHRQ